MKSIRFFLLAAFVIVTTMGYAQQKKSAEERALERKTTLTRGYKLTENQSQQIYDAALRFWKKVDEIQTMENGLKKKKTREENIEKWEQDLKNIMTEEQYKKLIENREKAKQKKQ